MWSVRAKSGAVSSATVRTASDSEAAHRVRPLRHASDVFVFGPELQWAPEENCIGLEWEEVKPRLIDRMIAERGIAFTGMGAMGVFDWLTENDVKRNLGPEVAEESFLIDWSVDRGLPVLRGKAKVEGSRNKVDFVAVSRKGEEPNFAGMGLSILELI